MSTCGLALISSSYLGNHQPMVVKKKATPKKIDEQHLAHVLELRQRAGLTNAQISRELIRRGMEGSPQAVGKWWKTGQISGPSLRVLSELADKASGHSPDRADKIAQAINRDGAAIDNRTIERLRTDITVLRKAVVLLALAVNEKTRGVAAEFSAYLRKAVPDAYFAERGFQVLLEAGLELADETAAEDAAESPAVRVRR